jgi:hypothetical protein
MHRYIATQLLIYTVTRLPMDIPSPCNMYHVFSRNRHQLDIELERRAESISTNPRSHPSRRQCQETEYTEPHSLLRDPRELLVSIGQSRGDRQSPLPADGHPGETLVPATDDLALAKHKGEGLARGVGVELLAGLELADVASEVSWTRTEGNGEEKRRGIKEGSKRVGSTCSEGSGRGGRRRVRIEGEEDRIQNRSRELMPNANRIPSSSSSSSSSAPPNSPHAKTLASARHRSVTNLDVLDDQPGGKGLLRRVSGVTRPRARPVRRRNETRGGAEDAMR